MNLPPELTTPIEEYIAHRSRSWKVEERIHLSRNLFSTLSVFFRSANMICPQDVTPKVWFSHVEARMKAGIKPSSLNTTLRILQSFLRYLKREGSLICETILEIHPLKTGELFPRNLTLDQVKALLKAISNPIDRAWILLMLHCGLRTCEVRFLKWKDVDLKAELLRIEESKGLNSRVVFLSPQVVQALNDLPRDSEFVFTYKNKPIDRKYCLHQLDTMGTECGFHATPHQLRHTCGRSLGRLVNASMDAIC
jgi:integrase